MGRTNRNDDRPMAAEAEEAKPASAQQIAGTTIDAEVKKEKTP